MAFHVLLCRQLRHLGYGYGMGRGTVMNSHGPVGILWGFLNGCETEPYAIKLSRSMFLFLPRDASAERGNATVSRPSVCLSVRPSVCL